MEAGNQTSSRVLFVTKNDVFTPKSVHPERKRSTGHGEVFPLCNKVPRKWGRHTNQKYNYSLWDTEGQYIFTQVSTPQGKEKYKDKGRCFLVMKTGLHTAMQAQETEAEKLAVESSLWLRQAIFHPGQWTQEYSMDALLYSAYKHF